MGLKSRLNKTWVLIRNVFAPKSKKKGGSDEVVIALNHLRMVLKREQLTVPHEVTVVVPRAEMRKRYENGQLVEEIYTYSSITIAHSPQHPASGSKSISNVSRTF